MSRGPGEPHHEKGRDRSMLFAACLQQIVNGFRAEFYVNTSPEKLSVGLRDDRDFSFDILGRLNYGGLNCEVWIEAKGYDTSNSLISHYRNFVANVALSRLYHARMQRDLFWFVASAPFGCDLGSEIHTGSWVGKTIREISSSVSGRIHPSELAYIEERGFNDLASHLRILLLTPELMKTTGIKQYPRAGENLWSLTEKLYGEVPLTLYQPYMTDVAARNNLSDPNLLQIGQPLDLPFLGMPKD